MFTKERLGWEEVQLLDLTGIRTLVALPWGAAGFLHELGVTFSGPKSNCWPDWGAGSSAVSGFPAQHGATYAAVAAGADGLIIQIHPRPTKAPCAKYVRSPERWDGRFG